MTVRVYTITGELVKSILSPSGTMMASWNAASMASGIYIASVTLQNANGGLIWRQSMKLLVLR
jgi:hypothetical protein